MSAAALWSLLRCPACGATLDFTAFDASDGVLRCRCQLWFPVVDGIPRIFVGEMRSVYRTDFADFLARHALDEHSEARTDETRAKIATRDSFGFEWTHFAEMLPDWEKNARFYFEPIGGAATLRGQTVLEAGCGKGRHTHYCLRAGGRVVAVDFSRAIDVAARNCRDVDGERLFVQADLTALPFAAGSFDAAFSIGVLHHLPDPESGFRRLVDAVRPGGRVLIYVYHALEGEPVKQAILWAVSRLRRITVRLPHRALLPLTTALGYGLYAAVVMPYKALARFAPTRQLAEHFPLKTYADYPVRVIVNDQFDRFSAPLEHRYRRDEVDAWLERAGLTDATILGGAGWRAVGRRAS
jgi:SAM-dependent methyltransferase